MIVLGIDPGTAVTGYGLIEGSRTLDYGCIRPPRRLAGSQRRQLIFEGICHLIERFEPEAMAVETQFVHPKNPLSAITLGMVRGIAILAATQHEIAVFEYSPARVKRAVTGNGRASKPQVQAMMAQLLKLSSPVEPEDAADALAIALCHLQSRQGARI